MHSGLSLRHATRSDVAAISALLSHTFYTQGWQVWCLPVFQLGLYYDLLARIQSPSQGSYLCWVVEHIQNEPPNPRRQIVGTIEVGLRTLALPVLQDNTPKIDASCSPSDLLKRQATNNGPRVPYISNLAVDRAYRYQGIGQSLIEQCEHQANQWKQTQIYLHVKPDNLAAVSLYEKLGYEPHCNRLSRLSYRHQRILLHKKLSPIPVKTLSCSEASPR